jgi:hypothetical protein
MTLIEIRKVVRSDGRFQVKEIYDNGDICEYTEYPDGFWE